MAENESLDLGGAYAKRWDAPFDAVRKGATSAEVVRSIEDALNSGLRKALKQLNKDYGVTLSELLKRRHDRAALKQLLKRADGHHYVRVFEVAAFISGSSEHECLRGWLHAMLDRIFDQICHRVAGQDNWPTFGDVRKFLDEVQLDLQPAVDKLVANFADNPAYLPRRKGPKGEKRVDSTARLLSTSLLRLTP